VRVRIGDLAARTGVSVRSLRYYEEQGLLVSERTGAGQRTYPESEVARVTFIKRLLTAGLTTKAIRGVMPCMDTPSDLSVGDALQHLLDTRRQIDEQITELQTTRDNLDVLISLTPGTHDCSKAS
jgi:DNA-binding transcriptional MerR regulator